MNRLFNTLRTLQNNLREKPRELRAMPGFENRISVLTGHAERATAYEDDLTTRCEEVENNLTRMQEAMEACIDAGRDRDALEYVRLAARIRPQQELLTRELYAFRTVSNELIIRVNTLMEHIEDARELAMDIDANPAAAAFLDAMLTRLTRYFVMLERVATARRRELPERLSESMLRVIDDRQLDLELAKYILARRRALGTGRS
jgi:hypothetical protein